MGVTAVELYRSGNASGPNLSRLRLADAHPDPDIETETDCNGEVIVKSQTGGVSVWEQPDPKWTRVWALPAGSSYPAELLIWCDGPLHWLIAPDGDMPLSRYMAALDVLARSFVRKR
jgi:hypothetical protein